MAVGGIPQKEVTHDLYKMKRLLITCLLLQSVTTGYSAAATVTSRYPSGFGPMKNWMPVANYCLPKQPIEVGDFNGDGLDDLVCFYKDTYTDTRFGDVMVTLSGNTAFGFPQRWHDFYSGTIDEVTKVGDFNGDGRDDLVNFNLPLPTRTAETAGHLDKVSSL